MSDSSPSQKEIDAAIEKSRLYLESQNDPSDDAHPKPTTPTKAEVEAALEKSADYLRSQGYKLVGHDSAPPAAGPADSGVSMTGTPTAPDSPPVDASRDTSNDSDKMVAKDNNTTTTDKKKD